MAIALPLGMSLSTLVSVIVAGGRAIYTAYDYTNTGVSNVKSSPSSRCLYHCSAITDNLGKIDKKLLQTAHGQKVVQDLVNCIEWSLSYDNKNILSKIFLSSSYMKKFETLNKALFQSYNYFILSNLLLYHFPLNVENYPNPETFTLLSSSSET